MSTRLFVALEPPPEVRAAAAAAREALRERFPDLHVRWQPDENVHLTLAFLGYVPDPDVEACADRLEACAGRARRFRATTTRLGAFPSSLRPSVIWLGIDAEPAAALAALQRDVATAFRWLHDDRRPFRPHITLGRVKSLGGSDRAALAGSLAELPPTAAAWHVDRAVLFASRLRPEGAIHTPVRTGTIPP
jgi:2'-5' RNA ligase